MKRRDLNFLSRSANLRLLQTATFVAVLGCLGMASFFVSDGAPLGRATISDTLASASFSKLPSVSTAPKPSAISESAVTAAAKGPSGDTVRYYEKDTGKSFSVALSTRRTDVLSDQRLSGFIDSLWIPGSQRVISSFQTPEGVEHRLFDYETKQSIVIGADLMGIAISPDGTNLMQLKKVSSDTSTVRLSAPDGTASTEILSTRADEIRVTWRTNDSLSVISRRNDRPGYDVSLLELTGALAVVLSNKENLEAVWSPDGAYLLYSYFVPGQGITLWLRSLELNKEIPLGVETSAAKCAWHPTGYVITCGVPMQTTLTRDVPADQTATIDDIVTYDFDETTFRRVYAGVKGSLMGVSHPFISPSGRSLVFTNTFDSRLYALPLK